VSRQVEDLNRRLLRARDAMDRAYAEPLDVRAVAAVAYVSEAHFIRTLPRGAWADGRAQLLPDEARIGSLVKKAVS
jgi:hypothetical protein